MAKHTEFIPRFQVDIRAEPSDRCFVMSCKIMGDDVGFIPSERQFQNIGAILAALRGVDMAPLRYEAAMSALDSHAAAAFNVTLNEAQAGRAPCIPSGIRFQIFQSTATGITAILDTLAGHRESSASGD